MSESTITLRPEERKKVIQDARANLRANAGITPARTSPRQQAEMEHCEVELMHTVERHRAEEEDYEGDRPQPQAPHSQAHAERDTETEWWLNYIDERMKAWCAGERDYWRQVLPSVLAEER